MDTDLVHDAILAQARAQADTSETALRDWLEWAGRLHGPLWYYPAAFAAFEAAVEELLALRAGGEPVAKELLTVKQVWREYGLPRDRLYAMIQSGELPTLRDMGRSHRNLIPRRVIEALLDEKVAEARRWREEHANDEPEVPGYLHF